jgi:hypothetical protein
MTTAPRLWHCSQTFAPLAFKPFTFVQISPPEAAPSRFASFTQSGETKDARRKALDMKPDRVQRDGVRP